MHHVVRVTLPRFPWYPPVRDRASANEIREWAKATVSAVERFTAALDILYGDGWLLEGEGEEGYHFQHMEVWTATEAESRLLRLNLVLPITSYFCDQTLEIPF